MSDKLWLVDDNDKLKFVVHHRAEFSSKIDVAKSAERG
jgi:hypothetical protein